MQRELARLICEEFARRGEAGSDAITLDRSPSVVGPGQAVVVPGGERHEVRALSAARVIVVDHPVTTTVGGLDTGAG